MISLSVFLLLVNSDTNTFVRHKFPEAPIFADPKIVCGKVNFLSQRDDTDLKLRAKETKSKNRQG